MSSVYASMFALSFALSPTGLFVGMLGLAVGLGLAAWLVAVEWGAWALVSPSRRYVGHHPEPHPWESVEDVAPDGSKLSGAWRLAGTDRAAILLHGFGEDRAAMLGRADALAEAGWSVLVADNRAIGRSGGAFVTFGGREVADLRGWVDLVAGKLDPAARVALWGRSMGGANAVRAAASDPRIAALVLEAPDPDLSQTLARLLRSRRLPGSLARPMLRRAGRLARVPVGRSAPMLLAPQLSIPACVIHGANDPLVPSAEARRLADAFARPALYLEVPGARHSDVFEVGGPELAATVVAFLENAVANHPSGV
ncbi:alpha/beta hydrolase [Isosphaeraceae bacterium EP7]